MYEIEFLVTEPIQRPDGSWTTRQYKEVKQYAERRHCDFCTSCGSPRYPDCTKTCKTGIKNPIPEGFQVERFTDVDQDEEDEDDMTDMQYKGMLLDQLEDWQEILDLAIEHGDTEIQAKAEKQISKINEKLKF